MKTDSWCEVSPMGELLVRSAQLYPDRDAVIFPEQKKTYAELYQGAARMARGLTALGIKSGNHVGLLSLNSIEFIEALFGIALIGAVSVPMNARHKARELGYIIDHRLRQ
jgi:acyl-CoA synthetase (AMP-forming)/AMP-acid ligase II